MTQWKMIRNCNMKVCTFMIYTIDFARENKRAVLTVVMLCDGIGSSDNFLYTESEGGDELV